HENEIAQSEAVTGKPLANYWLHNGMVKVDGEKMSKSLGNFTTIRDLLDRGVDPMALRLFVLMAQYRKPIDFTDEAILAATNGWHTIKEGLLFGNQHGEKLGWENLELNNANIDKSEVEKFTNAVDDDFNFPGGLAVIFELAKELRKEGNIIVHQGKTETPADELFKQWQTLTTLAEVLGLTAEPEAETPKTNGLSDAEIEEFIQKRQEARKAKNFAEADRIRDELKAQGIELIDSKEVTRWQIKN
ncbi:MAG: DALR domain-containing protein, partial [Sphaerospermopsis kisseleviana]